ncbi:MAG: hypothetical protein FWH37_08300 [Candidatus Bathyarchaeota archaeon]|nr:hypothetical protein [Candidatus Termiticorpusculum sp.]
MMHTECWFNGVIAHVAFFGIVIINVFLNFGFYDSAIFFNMRGQSGSPET